jgi:hypothetical protein
VSPQSEGKIYIYDDDEVKVAYAATNGDVYAISNFRKMANLRDGNLYTLDGQLLGYLTPVGAVRGVDGDTPDAFMRLVKME